MYAHPAPNHYQVHNTNDGVDSRVSVPYGKHSKAKDDAGRCDDDYGADGADHDGGLTMVALDRGEE
jgi:hypothetical protein